MAIAQPTVEVQWDGQTWTDVTADLLAFDTGEHGGARKSNPDRPTPAPAAGAMALEGAAAITGQRFNCRATIAGETLWEGWAQEPRRLRNPERTRWALEGRTKEHNAQRVEIARPAGTTAAMIADTELWGGLGAPTAVELPARNLKSIDYSGRRGGLLSRTALVASGEPIETRTGTVKIANPHVTAAPNNTRTITSAANRVIDTQTEHRADRVRNRATIRIEEVVDLTDDSYAATIDIDIDIGGNAAGTALPATLSLTGSLPLPSGTPLLDTATYANWSASVLSAEWIVASRFVQNRRQTYQNGPFNQTSLRVTGSSRVAVSNASDRVSATIGDQTADRAIPITVDITTTPAETFSQGYNVSDRGYLGGTSLPQPTQFRSATRANVWSPAVPFTIAGSAQPTYYRGTVGARVQLRLTATRTTGTVTPAMNITADDGPSQQLWGIRELDLPFWISSTSTTVVEAQLAGLSEVRNEHSFTLLLDEPIARTIDAGDYATLQIRDQPRDIDINEVCLVVGRRLTFGRKQLPKIRLRCLETGVSGPLPIRPPAGLTATALTTTSIRVAWGDVPAGSQPATGWHTETRPVTSTGAWARVASDASARTVDITGLPSATLIDVRVRAVTSAGNSAWANTTVRTLTPEPAPGVPQNLSVNAVGTSAIDADWNAPNTGGSVTSYTLRWRPHGTNAAWSARTGFSGRSGRITGLSPSTDYEVQVRANGPGGSSAYSASARATTADPPAPGVPANVAVSEGNAQLTVTWDDPSDGGAAANYTVEWTAGGVGLTHTLAAGTNLYTITGLTNDVEYTIRVRASNAGGTSAWSPAVTATPEATRLHGPTLSITATAGAYRYLQLRLDAYTPPAGYTVANNATVEVQRRVGAGNWSNTVALDRRHWLNAQWQNFNDPSFPKSVRARIRLTPADGTANVWSEWETTTYASAPSAEPDAVFVPLVQDGRLLLLDDNLIGQENPT